MTTTQVSELYVSIFNRASEKAGNDNWANNGKTAAENAQLMLDTDAAKAYFGSSLDTDAAFVEHIYNTTLNKGGADVDVAGKQGWVDYLAVEGHTRGAMVDLLVQAIADYKVGGSKYDTADQATKDAAQQFANRVAVSDYAAANLLEAPDDYATSLAFDGDLVVTADASTVVSSKGTIDTAVTAAAATDAEAIALTTSADVITGTSADDTINAYVGTNTISGDNQDTISSIDIIDGGAGTDTLNIQQSSTTNVNGATIANVENIVFTQFGSRAFNMSNVTGLESFTNKGSIATTTLTAVDSIVDLTVQNVNNNDTTLTYNDAAVAGITDTMNLTLSNASNSSDITIDSAAAGAIETLNITSTGSANKVTLAVNTAANDTLAATKTLNISGDQDLNLTAGTMAGLTTVTSTSTANVTMNLTPSVAKDSTITMGAGDDKIITTDITKDDVIDMGAGSDTLVLTAATDTTTAATLTGVETLAVAVAANASLNLEKATSLETLAVGTGGNVITVTKAAATAQTISFDTGAGTLGAVAYDSVVFGLKSATGTTDALTINVQNTDANGNHITSTKDTQKTITAVTANGIETINIVAADMGVDDSATANDSGLVISALNDDKLQTLNITSDTLVTITNGLDNDINDINATDAAGGVVLNLTNGADNSETTHANTTLNVDTGAGADTLSAVNLTAATTVINTGAGKDTITAKAGNIGDNATTVVETVTIDAGAGNDTVDLSLITSIATNATISVTLGDGVDKIIVDGAGLVTGVTITDFVVGAGGDKIDFATNAANDGGVALTGFNEAGVSGATVGMTIIDGTVSQGAAATVAQINAVEAINATSFAAAGDTQYVVYDDGTDTYLAYITEAGSDGASSGADTITILATLTGVSDASLLTVDNFTDFLA